MTLAHDVAGDGPVVVLLHSSVCDRRMWDEQRDALAGAGYRVVRPDFRGFGDTPAEAVRPYRDADDVVALLDTLGMRCVALVGAQPRRSLSNRDHQLPLTDPPPPTRRNSPPVK